MLQQEVSFFTQAQRRDHRLWPELALIVTMHSHAVVLIAVVIEQDTVEFVVDQRFYLQLDVQQGWRPGQGLEPDA